MNDIIADLIARINNGIRAKRLDVLVLKSNYSVRFLEVLEAEGFIRGYKFDIKTPNHLVVLLKYTENEPVIKKLKKISTKGRRIYTSVNTLWRLNHGWGTFIISTTEGLLTDEEAREYCLGGEIIAYIE